MNELLTRKETTAFLLDSIDEFKQKAFSWANQFDTFCYFDSNNFEADKFKKYDALFAIGLRSEMKTKENYFSFSQANSFDKLKAFYEQKKDWLFGFLTYDLKNEIENLHSDNFDGLEFPALHFFQPQYVLEIVQNKVRIHSKENDAEEIYRTISNFPVNKTSEPIPLLTVQARISKSKYLETVAAIRQHIIEGDLYEMNFCQEFFVERVKLDVAKLFWKLNQLGKAPFGCFYKWKGKYLACSSPERFLKKESSKLISQPIKGTAKRGATIAEDVVLRNDLKNSEKDRAENVMIVDLVRNDLAKSCLTGTVCVEELFGVYSFEQVHQMISTVTGKLRPEVHFVDAIKNAFPMGSMTGAPKVMSMELIEQYEATKRGIYSGAVGYITPDGDFDFNVVIRSLVYNEMNRYLSFQVGGAIVYDSVPEKEYEECLLKAKGMLEALGLQ